MCFVLTTKGMFIRSYFIFSNKELGEDKSLSGISEIGSVWDSRIQIFLLLHLVSDQTYFTKLSVALNLH